MDRAPAPTDRETASSPAITRRALLATSAAAAVTTALPAAAQTAAAPLRLDDASRLNSVAIARHWRPKPVTGPRWLDALRAELKAAAADGRPVSVGAARHSMGGQSLPLDGVAMTFDVDPGVDRWIDLDRGSGTYRVAAGARWRQVIAALDAQQLSPVVMQSNHDFGVAATLSVNAHGWAVPFGPFGSTVRSFRLMLATGEVVTCSPNDNAELFGLVMGGYGLFGVVTDLDVAMVDNQLLKPTYELMPAAQLGPRLASVVVQQPTIRMAYGRLAVDARRFLREALLITMRSTDGTPPPVTSGGLMVSLSREVFRAQIGSDTGKRARWYAESVAGPKASSGIASRNRMLNEPVANLAGRDHSRTDILHEYFLPSEGLETFLAACRTIMPASRQDLLNVTLRYVQADRTSVLAYAPDTRVAAVMLFSQRMTQADEEDMAQMTQKLIDAALDAGGSFYLPYRLHARREQVARAYPRLTELVARKRHYDPGLLFRHAMWARYMAS
ncbi:MAG TPA: FAD-binding oxidoreductase [Methylomirabilota bacterium]|nr:FAD-binding oxidoreductase [Methylomirabilota bacterium]